MNAPNVIPIVFQCAVVLMFGYLGWLAFKYRKHINPNTIQAAMRGERKGLESEVARQWAEEVKRFRRVSTIICLLFFVICVGLSIYGRATR